MGSFPLLPRGAGVKEAGFEYPRWIPSKLCDLKTNFSEPLFTHQQNGRLCQVVSKVPPGLAMNLYVSLMLTPAPSRNTSNFLKDLIE